MKKFVLTSIVTMAAFATGGMSYACDMHGAGGFGNFGMLNADWESYNPRVSTIDPALDADLLTPKPAKRAAQAKAKPSFSNAAGRASLRAKSRLAKKEKTLTSEAASDKAAAKTAINNAALNANR